MKLYPLLALSPIISFADSLYLESQNEYKMQLQFSPPPILTMQSDFLAPIELQFANNSDLSAYSVGQDVVDNRTKKLHAFTQIGSYGNGQNLLFRHRDAHFLAAAKSYRQRLDDYKDGDGNTVNASYLRTGQIMALGYFPEQNQAYQINFVYDSLKNDRQPQHNMDAISTIRRVIATSARWGNEDTGQLKLNLRHISLNRDANNYRWRSMSPSVSVALKRNRSFIEAEYMRKISAHKMLFGIHYEHDEHNGERYALLNNTWQRNAYRFPNVHSDRIKIFYEHQFNFNEQNKITAALGYDYLRADPKAKTQGAQIRTPSGINNLPAPNTLWQQYYGSGVNKALSTQGLNFLIAYQHETDKTQHRLSAESMIRQPDNVERFHALIGQNGNGWIGNPHLKPERHNRLKWESTWHHPDFMAFGKSKAGINNTWELKLSADYDHVKNFITLDRDHNRQNNIISHNVDARLIGLQFEYAQNINTNLAFKSQLRYQYGENTSDNRPLYNVRPLEADLIINWKDYLPQGSYNLSAQFNYVHKQNRLDNNEQTGFGYDNKQASYALVNLNAGLQLKNRFSINFSINNLFNRQYYAFNEIPHVAATRYTNVAAPGRNYWLGFNFNF